MSSLGLLTRKYFAQPMLSTKAIRQATTSVTTKPRQAKQIGRNVVLIDGVRTPFLTFRSDFKDLGISDLQSYAFRSLLNRTGLPLDFVDYVLTGLVTQLNTQISNVARIAAVQAGLSDDIPCHTISMGCVSSNAAINTGMMMIRLGESDIIMAGGVDSTSDAPIKIRPEVRGAMIDIRYIEKTLMGKAKKVFQILRHVGIEIPSSEEYTSNEIVGHNADRLAASFGVTRVEQDEFACRSHILAHKATQNGYLSDIIAVHIPGKEKSVSSDNGIKLTTPEEMANLKPVFIKPHGTVTAANSSFLTDGASALLMMSEEKALELGYKPKAYLRDSVFVSQDPKDQCLLGPAYAIPKILNRNGLKLSDIDVIEIHEAFAGQVLANLKALDSDYFSENYIGSSKVGAVPMEKLNTWGGSLSIGHPFGATGARLVTTAANRLHKEDGRFALLAACASGGQGNAMLVERYPS